MKTLMAVMLFAVYGLAQQSSTLPLFHQACGPLQVKFETSISTSRPPSQPEPGKALVYVVEDFQTIGATIGAPTFKIGLDGAWVGATHGSSYLVFSVDPGEHHMCIQWQSHLDGLSRLVSFARLTAEPDKTYYFRARAMSSSSTATMYLDLDSLDPDEGQYMIASSPVISAHAKK
jgi:hypothetical protein